MKQFRYFLSALAVLLVIATVASAADRTNRRQQLSWDQDVRVAWKTALESDRPLLVFVTMDECVYCERMKRSTLKDRYVVSDLQSNFVPVALNVKDAPDFVKMLEVNSFPTTVIIETNGDVMESMKGYLSAKQLRQRMHTTLRQVAQERREVRR